MILLGIDPQKTYRLPLLLVIGVATPETPAVRSDSAVAIPKVVVPTTHARMLAAIPSNAFMETPR